MSEYILGLDLAISTGFVVVRGEELISAKQILAPTALTRYSRGEYIAKAILANLPDNGEYTAVIEDYAVGHASSAVAVIELGAIIRYNLAKAGLEWINVAPSTLKKWVSGNGRASKPQMLAAVNKRWGQSFKVHDVADAYGLARFGQDPDFLRTKGVHRNER